MMRYGMVLEKEMSRSRFDDGIETCTKIAFDWDSSNFSGPFLKMAEVVPSILSLYVSFLVSSWLDTSLATYRPVCTNLCFHASMKIRTTIPLHPRPPLIKRLNNLIRQRPLLKIGQILLKLLFTTRPNNNSIPHLPPQQRMMTYPSQRTLRLTQSMFLCRSSKNIQRIEIILLPIPFSIISALISGWIETASGFVVLLVAVVAGG